MKRFMTIALFLNLSIANAGPITIEIVEYDNYGRKVFAGAVIRALKGRFNSQGKLNAIYFKNFVSSVGKFTVVKNRGFADLNYKAEIIDSQARNIYFCNGHMQVNKVLEGFILRRKKINEFSVNCILK